MIDALELRIRTLLEGSRQAKESTWERQQDGGLRRPRRRVDEPLCVFVTGYSAIGLRDRRRQAVNLRYSWLEDYLARLDGKEARRE
jgi:hypothetical protein